jgi:hypothetical protein
VATSTATNKFAKLFVAASTRTILVFGAIACAHSISSAASCAQPQFVRGFKQLAKNFLKQSFAVVHAGNPNWAEKTFESFPVVA